jgi:2-phosphoglycolate phosphatase
MSHLICLDLDGTLEDSRSDMVAAVHRVRARLGLPSRSHEAVLPWVNRGMEALYRACFDDYLQGDAGLSEVRIQYETDYLENVAVETRLYPGIAGALKHLSALAPLAAVTNKPERISRRLLDLLGVGNYFKTVIGGDTCAATKPDPLLLKEAAQRSGFDPMKGRAIMIGDTAADIKMGQAFGALTVWCVWGYAQEPDEASDFIAPSPEVLPALVETAFSFPKRPLRRDG